VASTQQSPSVIGVKPKFATQCGDRQESPGIPDNIRTETLDLLSKAPFEEILHLLLQLFDLFVWRLVTGIAPASRKSLFVP
jgi:hypothetical protein